MKTFVFALPIVVLVSFLSFGQSTEIKPGSVLPQMTTVQRTGLAMPVNGMLVFDSDTESYWYYQSSGWTELPSASYWKLEGAAGNEIKNTNEGGFWSGSKTVIIPETGTVTAPDSGNGTRFMWIQNMGVLRAGTIGEGSKAWDKDSIGWNSTAFGYNNKAKGLNNFIAGFKNETNGNHSASLGGFNAATGSNAIALGRGVLATADFSLGMGFETLASGNYATAFGNNTQATGLISTAFGYKTAAISSRSTAFGTETVASGSRSTVFGQESTASGFVATAFGHKTIASGPETTAFGKETQASGARSTAFGENTIASGNRSTAFGRETVASGWYTTALGYYTEAKARYAIVMGAYNDTLDNPSNSVLDTDRLLQLGNGSSAIRSNALTILRNANTGINTASPDAMLHVNGFTKLGDDAPKIKMKKYTGTTSNSQGGVVDISHSLDPSKIIGNHSLVKYDETNHRYIHHAYVAENGYEYDLDIQQDKIRVKNISGNSGSILSKPISIIILYTE